GTQPGSRRSLSAARDGMRWHRRRLNAVTPAGPIRKRNKWLVSIATRSRSIVPQSRTRSKRKRSTPTVEHIAIDLGSRESQVCVRNERGEILLERKVPTAGLARYLAKRPQSRVIVESCAE